MKHEGSTHPRVCHGIGADEREGFVFPLRLFCLMFLLAFIGHCSVAFLSVCIN